MKLILPLILAISIFNDVSQVSVKGEVMGVVYCSTASSTKADAGMDVYVVAREKMPKDFERRTIDSLLSANLSLSSLAKGRASSTDLEKLKQFRIQGVDDIVYKALEKRAAEQCRKIIDHNERIKTTTDGTGHYSILANEGGYYILLRSKCSSVFLVRGIGTVYIGFVPIKSHGQVHFNFTFPY